METDAPMTNGEGTDRAVKRVEFVRCKSHPKCSHNTENRDLDLPCSIGFGRIKYPGLNLYTTWRRGKDTKVNESKPQTKTGAQT